MKYNPYIEALKSADPNLTETDQNLPEVDQIFSFAEANPKFHYGAATRLLYNSKYTGEAWIGRKFVAIPAALFSGTIKVIYHLAKAIFIGVFCEIAYNNTLYLLGQIYYLGRDLQETYGWLTTFFNDQYGQFHVLESDFQKQCYDKFITYKLNPYLHHLVEIHCSEEEGVFINHVADKVNLKEFKTKIVDEQAKLCKFDRSRLLVPGDTLTFNQFLEQTSDEILEDLTLADITIKFEKSPLMYAVLSSEDFEELKIESLPEDIHKRQLSFIAKRAEKIHKNSSDLKRVVLDPDPDFPQFTFVEVLQLSIDEIEQYKEKIPTICFHLFSNDQLKGLKISELTKSQNTALFHSLNEQETKKRLELFSEQEVANAINNQLLEGAPLRYISSEVKEKLLISKLEESQIIDIFDRNNELDEGIAIFASYPSDEVVGAIEKGLLSTEYLFSLPTGDQFKQIDFSKISQNTLNLMFPPWEVEDLREKYSFWGRRIKTEDGKVIEDENGWICNYSDEELQKESLEQKEKNEQRLGLLTPEQREVLEPLLYQKDPSDDRRKRSEKSDFGFDFSDPFFAEFFKSEFGSGFSEFFGQTSSAPQKKSEKDNLSVLGLKTGASKVEIKERFKKMALECHPDKNPRKKGESDESYKKRTELRFIEVTAAAKELLKG